LRPCACASAFHTGPAIVGNVGAPGRINYTLIGDAVNTAQRLEQYAKTIAAAGAAEHVIAVVSEATAKAVSGAYRLAPLGEVELRGRGEKTVVYRLA
jgi:adenylate cyclase